MIYNDNQIISVEYTNYKGIKTQRNVVPKRTYYGSTEYHEDEQWLMELWDIDKKAVRTFALKDMNFTVVA